MDERMDRLPQTDNKFAPNQGKFACSMKTSEFDEK